MRQSLDTDDRKGGSRVPAPATSAGQQLKVGRRCPKLKLWQKIRSGQTPVSSLCRRYRRKGATGGSVAVSSHLRPCSATKPPRVAGVCGEIGPGGSRVESGKIGGMQPGVSSGRVQALRRGTEDGEDGAGEEEKLGRRAKVGCHGGGQELLAADVSCFPCPPCPARADREAQARQAGSTRNW
jgi:hypothetical protein